MRVLIACEYSGTVRDAFRRRGHDAWSCDLVRSARPGPHYQMDARRVLDRGWDLLIAHPPCQYLSIAGNAHLHTPGRAEAQADALAFFLLLYHAPIARVAIENPVGVVSRRFRPPDQIIQPYYFGDPARKTTCLWLRNLPPLVYTGVLSTPEPRGYCIKRDGRRLNYHYVQGKTAHERSRTFPGIAAAMADQWGAV